MNLKLFVAQSIWRLCVGSVRLPKLEMKRIPFVVILAAFGSLSLLFFQNFTAPPPPPSPPANYVMRPNYKFTPYEGYPIAYVPRGNPRPISPTIAAQNYLRGKAASMISAQQLSVGPNQAAACKTIAVTYSDTDPKTNLAVRTFTFACGNIVITRNDVFDRGPHGSPNPVGQLIIKTPVNLANVTAAKHK